MGIYLGIIKEIPADVTRVDGEALPRFVASTLSGPTHMHTALSVSFIVRRAPSKFGSEHHEL